MRTWTIPPLAGEKEATLRARIDAKTKPPGSLGRLEALALQLGLIQGSDSPELRRGTLLVFAGDHGLADEGVSPYPSSVTAQMVHNFLHGGAAINVFARQHQLELRVVDAGVAADLPPHPGLLSKKVRYGTRNARYEPALTSAEIELCLERGAESVSAQAASGADAILFGEMGIGNTAAASLICSALLDLPLDECIGRGAGHDDAGLARKRAVLRAVRSRHAHAREPLEILAAFGGCEIAMMVGAMLEAASRRLLIVNDGFIVTASLLVASRLYPGVLDYTVAAHVSAESAHARILQELRLRPLLDLGLRLGEGTGAAMAWPILVSACRFLHEMATFQSAGVSGPSSAVIAP